MKMLHKLKSMKSSVIKGSLMFSMVFAFAVCFSAFSVQAQNIAEVPENLANQFYGVVNTIKTDLEHEIDKTQSPITKEANRTIINYFNEVLVVFKNETYNFQDAFKEQLVVFGPSDDAPGVSRLANNLFEHSAHRGTQYVNAKSELKNKIDAVHIHSEDGLVAMKELYFFILQNR